MICTGSSGRSGCAVRGENSHGKMEVLPQLAGDSHGDKLLWYGGVRRCGVLPHGVVCKVLVITYKRLQCDSTFAGGNTGQPKTGGATGLARYPS